MWSGERSSYSLGHRPLSESWFVASSQQDLLTILVGSFDAQVFNSVEPYVFEISFDLKLLYIKQSIDLFFDLPLSLILLSDGSFAMCTLSQKVIFTYYLILLHQT